MSSPANGALPPPRIVYNLACLVRPGAIVTPDPRSLPEPWRGAATALIKRPPPEQQRTILQQALVSGQFGAASVDPLYHAMMQVQVEKPFDTSAEYGFTWQSATELAAQSFPPLLSVVDGLFYEGCTLLCGSPKAGKSLMMLSIVIAACHGGFALGSLHCAPTDVLYLALEDGPRRIQRRLAKACQNVVIPPNLRFVYKAKDLGSNLVEGLEAYLQANPNTRFVVIDTLARIRGKRGMNGQAYQQDYEEASPLTELAQQYRICLVLIHHTRKAHSEDAMDMVNATQGLAGSVDSVAVLQRVRGESAATIHVMGRDLDEELQYGLRFDPLLASYVVEGDANSVKLTPERKEIVTALKAADKPLSPKQISDITGRDYNSTMRVLLQKMLDDGTVVKQGYGFYALPSL